MPLYEYICHACGHEFEEIQKFSDRPLTKCPNCGKNKVVKKISLTAFQLKGEGWYKDGYARPSENPKQKSKDTSSESKAKATSSSSKNTKSN